MIAPDVFRRVGVKPDAELPSFTSLGGYPLAYYAEDGGVFCADCVNGEDVREIDDPQWNVMEVDTHLEGAPLHCDNCNAEIPSAYGDPEEDDG
jgi:hypothetical protein